MKYLFFLLLLVPLVAQASESNWVDLNTRIDLKQLRDYLLMDPPDTTVPPVPPEPGEGCAYIGELSNPVVGPITEGVWAGWCKEPGDRGATGGPDGARGFRDREWFIRDLNLGNRVRTEVEVMLPPHWYGMGGYHFGGYGICPTHFGDCIRLDWNAPVRTGLKMTIYQNAGGRRQEARCNWTTGEQVFFDNEWTKLIFQVEYLPETGQFSGYMEYQNPHISGGKVRVTREITILPNNTATIGRFVKWGKMNLAGPGKYEICWIKEDSYHAW